MFYFRFNTKKAIKGIHFLQEQGLLGKRPEDVAEYFQNDSGGRLDKVSVIITSGSQNEVSDCPGLRNQGYIQLWERLYFVFLRQG